MNSIRIEIPSLSENIRMIESFIDNAKDKFKFNDAVTEAVNNAIKHGNQGQSTKNVGLALSLEEGLIKFKVEDEGGGFDFQNLPDPTAPENLEKPGGRGIFLMKHLSDEVDFKEGGRVVELSFYIDA